MPTSSSVLSVFWPMPKRIRKICSSWGVSVASILRVRSARLAWIAASSGDSASSSSTKSPTELSSSLPIGVSSEIGSLTIFSTIRTFSSGISICAAISSKVGSRPRRCTNARVTRSSLLVVSNMWTGKSLAIAEFKEAIRLKPDFAEVHNNLGSALYAEGQRDAAITEYKEAIRLKPDDAKAHNNLGLALYAEGQRDAATAEYREATRLKRDLATAH